MAIASVPGEGPAVLETVEGAEGGATEEEAPRKGNIDMENVKSERKKY